MPLHLRIENETSLPDGGPISYTMQSSRGGINIGRDQYLDWVLPDPTRFVSGTHCEIRYRNGQFWLHDVSTNGTFLNGSEYRLAGPHALKSGDRLEIGRYIVVVEIEGEPNLEPARDLASMNRQLPPDSPLVWNMPDHEAPTPIDPRELDHRRNARSLNSASFLDWMADLPPVAPPPASAPPGYPPPGPSRSSAPPPAADQWLQPPALWDAPAPPPSAPQFTPQFTPPAAPVATPAPSSWDPIPFEGPAQRLPPASLPPASLPPALAAFDPPPRPAAAPQWDLPPAAPEPAAPFPPPAPPPYAAAPAPMAPPVTGNGAYGRGDAAGQDFISRFARGARVPRDAFRNMDQGDFAEMVGELMFVTVENLRQLQVARAQFKGKIRSSNQTIVGAQDINPLRFLPSADAVMRVMFGPPQAGYLDARTAVDRAFDDIKQHQLATVGALQNAVQQALRSVSPKAIEAEVSTEKGVSNLLGSRKARLWEKYCELWKAEFGDDEEAAMASFLRLFADSYDGRK